MLRVPVHQLEPNMVLARAVPVPNEQGRTLIGRGCKVSPVVGERLQQHGIFEVWIECTAFDFIKDLVDAETAERQRELYWVLRRYFEVDITGTSKPIDLPRIDAVLTSLYETMQRSGHGSVLMEKLDSYDNYLVSHSTNVCYLSLLVSMQLERYLVDERKAKTTRIKDAKELALGCLLHDVGKIKLPLAIVNKPGPLTADEMDLMKMHTTLGYELVRGRIPAASAQVVLNHHQRFDGTGYPERIDPQTKQKMPALAGKQIPVFSRIASVCDVFDAATTKRCYSEAKPPVQALWEMQHQHAGAFDPVVEAALRTVVPAFPIGSVVTMSDHSEAVVVGFAPAAATRPKVQRWKRPDGSLVAHPDLDEIDLAHCDDLTIVAAGGVDVRPFVPTTPSLALA